MFMASLCAGSLLVTVSSVCRGSFQRPVRLHLLASGTMFISLAAGQSLLFRRIFFVALFVCLSGNIMFSSIVCLCSQKHLHPPLGLL